MFGLVLVLAVTGVLSAAAGPASSPGAAPAATAGTYGARLAPLPLAEPAYLHALPAAVPAVEPAVSPAPAVAVPVVTPAVAPKPKPKPKPALAKNTPCKATASACVDLSANRAWLLSDGVVQYGPVPITHGRKGFRTPTGTFRVGYKAKDHVSTIYDAEMPYSVFFNSGIAFHQGSLAVLSHGCIHLSGKAARTFFGSLGRGEVVQVVN